MRKFLSHCVAYFDSGKSNPRTSVASLAPKVLRDKGEVVKIKPYLDLISKTLEDDDITNIAITGGYGAGKSTILKTFQFLNPQYDYLNISLASFKDVKKVEKPDDSDDLERHLEVSILQQIFYHVKPSDIPDSRFKRIVNVTNLRLWFIAIGLSLWLTSVIILFRFNYIDKINPANWGTTSLDVLVIALFLIFFAGIGWFAKDIVRLFSNSKINKFNIKGELELGDKLDKSVFNEHLEEIIYFFERTDYNVVVIEDLDRFESTDIFTKLREINILLNQSKLIKRRINFLYAIRDEVFTDKSERVKFFEYIIPVIPFINPSNAGDQLAKLVKEAKLEDILSKDFTEDVVTFIDDIDMRLLINIFHEYLIYRQNLDEGLNQDRLFAMITYKNLYPDDFGLLNKRTGNLYGFLNNKNTYISTLIEAIDTELSLYESALRVAEGEELNSIHELNAIYINKLRDIIPNSTGVVLDGELVKYNKLLEEEYFSKLQVEERFIAQVFEGSSYSTLNNRTTKKTFSDIQNALGTEYSYDERKQMIKNKSTNKQRSIRENIQKLNAKKGEIESWTLKRIFEEVDVTPYLTSFENNLLVRNLLINGYINENYSDYISLFHEVNISKEDFKFLRNVKSGINTSFTYELNKIENLIKKIPRKYFYRDVVFNYSLMDFLGKNYGGYKNLYQLIIDNVSSAKTQGLDFAYTYMARKPETLGLFVKSLAKAWKGYWDNILKRNLTEEDTKWHLKLLFKYADNADILKFRQGFDIAMYIEKRNDFLELVCDIEPKQKTESILADLGIKFDSILAPSEAAQDLFEFVYQNNHYKLNSTNVSLFAIQKDSDITEAQLKSANYSTIIDSKCDGLKSYIEENIDAYVKNVLLRNPENTMESEPSAIALLNNDSIDIATRIDFIRDLSPVITDIDDLNSLAIIKILMKYNKIGRTWRNIYSYFGNFENGEIDEHLVNYLNEKENYEALASRDIKSDIDEDEPDIRKLIVAITLCDGLDLPSYKALVKSFKYTWTRIGVENLSVDKVGYLVEEPILSGSVENYEKLKEHFSDEGYHIRNLEKNFDYLIREFDSFNLDIEEIRSLLSSDDVGQDRKLELLQQLGDELIIDDGEISKMACKIYSSHPSEGLSFELIESMFTNGRFSEHKIRILNQNLDNLSPTEVTNLVTKLGGSYPDIFRKQHKPKFSNSDYHNHLFGWLKRKGLIKNYGEYPKDKTLLRVTANYS